MGPPAAKPVLKTDDGAFLTWLRGPARDPELLLQGVVFAPRGPRGSRRRLSAGLPSVTPPAYDSLMGWCAAQHASLCSRLLPWLGGLVLDYPYYEWMLQSDPEKPGYRDHSLHALRVAHLADLLWARGEVTGGALLPLGGAGGATMPEVAQEPYPGAGRKALLLAALFHDLGYPQAFLARLATQAPTGLLALTSAEPAACLGRALELVRGTRVGRWIREAGGLDGRLAYEGLVHAFLAGSHGVWAALALLEVRRHLQPGAGLEGVWCLEQAALAVLQHDVPEELLPPAAAGAGWQVPLEDHPLGFVLIAADVLQEWGRPTLVARPLVDPKVVRLEVRATATVSGVEEVGPGVVRVKGKGIAPSRINEEFGRRLAGGLHVDD